MKKFRIIAVALLIAAAIAVPICAQNASTSSSAAPTAKTDATATTTASAASVTVSVPAASAAKTDASVTPPAPAASAAKTDATATTTASATSVTVSVPAPSSAKTDASGTPPASAASVEKADTSAKTVPAETKPWKSPFAQNFWALVPPLFAILLALITKEVYSSLFLGIVLGGCFVANFHPLKSMDAIVNTGLIGSLTGIAGIFVFLVELGIMVALISRSGATQAFGRWAEKHVKTRIGAQLATFVLGVLIFIDDYFNCLTVGSVMMPVTDAKRVSRAKLAYLIDATAAPICMIAPISSWGAAVTKYAEGTEYTGLELFVRAIPYNFYSLLTFVFVLGIVFLKIDFGPMARHERNAIEKGDLITDGEETEDTIKPFENANGLIHDMVIPVIVLLVICVFALVYVGGILDGKSFIAAFSNPNPGAAVGLPWGGLIALAFTIIYLAVRGVIPLNKAMKCISEGFIAMVPALLILTFATGLKDITTALGAKEYIKFLMEGQAAGLSNFLPAIIFLVGCMLSFSTGTSWGTFGILIPIVISIFPVGDPRLFIGMSACLAGAVAGDHCSPISDTTIMASAGAKCPHVNHVSTQLPYVIVVCVFSFIGFLMAPFIKNWYITFPILIVLMIFALVFLKLVVASKSRTEKANIEVVPDSEDN